MSTERPRIILGYINGLYGIQGWVKIYSYTRPLTNIFNYNPWQVKVREQWQTVSFREGRTHGKGLVAHLEPCHDRNEALRWLNAEIAVYREQLPPTAEDDYYWADLIGLTVINSENRTLGQIVQLLETGANDVLVVKGEREHLIPFLLNHSIKQIDLTRGLVHVDWSTDF